MPSVEFRIQDCLGLRHMGRRSFFQIVVNSDVDNYNAQILEALTLKNPSEPPGKKRHVRILYIEQVSKLHDLPVSISNNNNKELYLDDHTRSITSSSTSLRYFGNNLSRTSKQAEIYFIKRG